MMEMVPVIGGDDKPLKTKDFRGRNLKSLKQGLERLFGRRTITITEYDPTYKVAYLGNVLTGWAKGDSCTEKPLNTLWKNYTSTTKPDVHMKLIVTQSGLKAITKEHGLTEYWSHRITYCCAPTELPKIFCWVYRHEGRKLKQELRCHAVLCAKESTARQIASQLQARLAQALLEFKRDKISRQNARLSLANAVYDNPSLPRRKILLSTGANNYRPPLERSKSAPKLMSIEESLEEEDENTPAAAIANGVSSDHHRHHYKKLPRRVDLARAKFATCRNLTYSSRGGGASRMGGLHGIRFKNLTTSSIGDVDSIESSQGGDNDDESVSIGATICNDVVEENPFGRDCNELDVVAFSEQLKLSNGDHDNGCKTAAITRQDSRLLMGRLRTSTWAPLTDDEEDDEDRYSSCPPSYVHTCNGNGDANVTAGNDDDDRNAPRTPCVNAEEELDLEDDSSKFDSLVRSRRRLFECGGGERSPNLGGLRRCYDGASSPRRGLIKNRKKLFERIDRVSTSSSSSSQSSNNEDADSALQFDLSEDARDPQPHHRGRMDSGVVTDTECGGYALADDESATPSLQSISSGSDTSSPSSRDCGGGVNGMTGGKNYDLDSLWEEEDSDESGFVESIGGGQEANDDKIRDLPHHLVMKQCGVLSSKPRCVEV